MGNGLKKSSSELYITKVLENSLIDTKNSLIDKVLENSLIDTI